MQTIVQIPGGTATLRDPKQLRVKHRRPMLALISSLGQKRVTDLQRASVSGGSMDVESCDLMLRVTQAMVYALLESWTIDEPLPQTVDDVDEMLGDVYEALAAEVNRVNAEHVAGQPVDEDGNPVDPFSVAAVEDLTSPTGASVGSRAPSTAVARRAPSDRKKPSSGRSTAAGKRSA